MLILEIAAPAIKAVLERILTKENWEKYGDLVLDFIESMIERSENTADDIIFLPTLKLIRDLAGIPDNDNEPKSDDGSKPDDGSKQMVNILNPHILNPYA